MGNRGSGSGSKISVFPILPLSKSLSPVLASCHDLLILTSSSERLVDKAGPGARGAKAGTEGLQFAFNKLVRDSPLSEGSFILKITPNETQSSRPSENAPFYKVQWRVERKK